MIGEIAAIISALLWSSSSIMIKSASQRIGVLSLNALRASAGAVFVVATLFVTGKTGELWQLPLWPSVYLIGAVFVGMGIGDTLYFRSITLIGVSRALPVSYIYPLFTLPIAVIFLGEGLSWLNVAGTVLVVAGVTLVGRTSTPQDGTAIGRQRFAYEGFLMALAAGLCWAFSTAVQKVALLEMDVFVANSVRTTAVALILLFLATRSAEGLDIRSYGRGPLFLAGLAGVVSLGLGGLTFLLSVQEAGAAKAAALSAIAPIFAAPLSVIFLKEKLTLPLVVGTTLTVVGVWLIIVRG